jgi:hypothetical protein
MRMTGLQSPPHPPSSMLFSQLVFETRGQYETFVLQKSWVTVLVPARAPKGTPQKSTRAKTAIFFVAISFSFSIANESQKNRCEKINTRLVLNNSFGEGESKNSPEAVCMLIYGD